VRAREGSRLARAVHELVDDSRSCSCIGKASYKSSCFSAELGWREGPTFNEGVDVVEGLQVGKEVSSAVLQSFCSLLQSCQMDCRASPVIRSDTNEFKRRSASHFHS
jgi:hypothetical protein